MIRDLFTRFFIKVSGDKWMGRCGDSFCYSSCTMAHCRPEMRLGSTPEEHNRLVDQLHQQRADKICDIYKLSDGNPLRAEV